MRMRACIRLTRTRAHACLRTRTPLPLPPVMLPSLHAKRTHSVKTCNPRSPWQTGSLINIPGSSAAEVTEGVVGLVFPDESQKTLEVQVFIFDGDGEHLQTTVTNEPFKDVIDKVQQFRGNASTMKKLWLALAAVCRHAWHARGCLIPCVISF